MTALMIDIETLDVKPTAKIVEIGWCVVPTSQELSRPNPAFRCGPIPVTPIGQELVGLTESKSTLDWWQADETRRNSLLYNMEHGLPLHDALEQLGHVIEAVAPTTLWCKGASFDFAILRNAYLSYDMEVPWHYRAEKCMRVLSLFVHEDWRKAEIESIFGFYKLTQHNGRDDAIAQAVLLRRTLEAVFEDLDL